MTSAYICLLGELPTVPAPTHIGLHDPDLIKLVHYISQTSIIKRAVGLQLKGILVAPLLNVVMRTPASR